MKNKICVGMNIIIKNLISSVEEMNRRLKRRVKRDLALGRVVRTTSKGDISVRTSGDRPEVSERSGRRGRSRQKDSEAGQRSRWFCK